MASKPYEITSPTTFLDAYYENTNEENNLLYELYQQNILLNDGLTWKPNHFVGDFKLRTFESYLNNRVD